MNSPRFIFRYGFDACLVTSILLLPVCSSFAQGVGVSGLGVSGGFNYPSAYALDEGLVALSIGNDADPKLGYFNRQRNYSAGFGLGYGLEVFARLTDYTTPASGQVLSGVRDLSGNVKWQLPFDVEGLPKLAVGRTDISGSTVATFFKSTYAVMSDEVGPVRWSLGYGRSEAANHIRVLDGVFGGVELRLLGSRATLLAESDGTIRHSGFRYYSEPLSWLGDAQLVSSIHRSFGATDQAGRGADKTSVGLSVIVPMGLTSYKRRGLVGGVSMAAGDSIAIGAVAFSNGSGARDTSSGLEVSPDVSSIPAVGVVSLAARLEGGASVAAGLLTKLQRVGLDKVRVGVLGRDLVLDYENQRYLHSELDALGLALGLAAQGASETTERIHAIVRKEGLVVFEVSVNAAAYRDWLANESALVAARASLGAGRLAGYDEESVAWVVGSGQSVNRVQFSLSPQVRHTLGTEYGLMDYSFGLQARASANLWRGGIFYADWLQRVSTSANMERGEIFDTMQLGQGLRNVAVQHSIWLGSNLFISVGAGRYRFKYWGGEGEAFYYLPWGEDSLHFQGQLGRRSSKMAGEPDDVGAALASYRWRVSSQTWLEAGLNRYTYGDNGPSLSLTRWFDDVSLSMFARKGGTNTFVGLGLSVPLTPRRGMAPATVQFGGASRFADEARTLLARNGNVVNWIKPKAVRPVELGFQAEQNLLDSGRLTPEYIRDQMPRLKRAFDEFSAEVN